MKEATTLIWDNRRDQANARSSRRHRLAWVLSGLMRILSNTQTWPLPTQTWSLLVPNRVSTVLVERLRGLLDGGWQSITFKSKLMLIPPPSAIASVSAAWQHRACLSLSLLPHAMSSAQVSRYTTAILIL